VEFEWDENKRLKTLRERKIDFIDIEVIRIILARRANRKEREMYEKRTFSSRTVS
jgi:uncharacterized DUF497 family protein